MKLWIIPALLGTAALGFVAGRWIPSGNVGLTPRAAPSESRPNQASSPPTQSAPREAIPVPIAASLPSPSPKSARQRLVELLSGHFDPEKQYRMISNAAFQELGLQREIVEILRTTDDPAFMEECQALLTAVRDAGLLNEILEAFRTEQNPDRRLAWAYILGSAWDKAQILPLVLDLLDGTDTKLQTRLLQRMSLQALPSQKNKNERERATARLRLLAQSGENDSLRAAAAGALRGAEKPDDIRFLIDLLIHDRSADVQNGAFESLPSNYQGSSPLLEEQTRAMYEAALDGRRSPGLRKALADRALDNSAWDESDPNSSRFLSPQECATLKAITGKKE